MSALALCAHSSYALMFSANKYEHCTQSNAQRVLLYPPGTIVQSNPKR